MQLSKNFSLKEMTKSQTAERHGLTNNPSEDHQDNLKKLCENILQPVRDEFGVINKESEDFIKSEGSLDNFDKGKEMEYPFNQNNNEGGATITIDNNALYFTICSQFSSAYNNSTACSPILFAWAMISI